MITFDMALPEELAEEKELLKETIVAELKKDREWMRLYDRWTAAKDLRHKSELMKQMQRRAKDFTTSWMKRLMKNSCQIKDMIMILDGEDQKKYIWYMCLSLFLADFLEDIIMEMGDIVKKNYPKGSLDVLDDFIELKKKVRIYTRQALKDETDESVELFDEHAREFKLMMFNKARGYMNAIIKREVEKERQLETEWEEPDETARGAYEDETS